MKVFVVCARQKRQSRLVIECVIGFIFSFRVDLLALFCLCIQERKRRVGGGGGGGKGGVLFQTLRDDKL